MSKTSTYEDEILKLIFHNIGISEVGDATGLLPSTTEGSFYIALYSVTPTNTTNGTEATYSGYARVAVPRNATNWDISGSAPTRASNALAITFPSSTTAETINGMAICFTNISNPKYFANFVTPLSIINGSIPKIQIGQLKVNED